jgi:DNA topoisomerase-3
LPESQWGDANNIFAVLELIDENFKPLIALANMQLKSPIWNDKKISAHHAIIPTTNCNINIQTMSDNEYKVYHLICRYYIAQFVDDYVYQQRSVSVRCNDQLFQASSHTPITLGWKQVLQSINANDDNFLQDKIEEAFEHVNKLPQLVPEQRLTHSDHHIKVKQTKPQPRFTEGMLIDAMKSIGKYVDDPELKKVLKDTSGIGTEATRASIIETLFKRDYIVRKGKSLQSTPIGRKLIACLPPIVCDPALTARWEQALEHVAEGKLELAVFMEEQTALLQIMMTALTRC